jgi:ankyrin repeat protein
MNAQQVIAAIKAGDADHIKPLLAADPSLAAARTDEGISAIMLALYYNKSAIAELLIEAGIVPDIYEATSTGRLDRVKELVQADPALVNSWSADGFTALHYAAFFNHPSLAEYLLQAGASVNAVSRNNMKVMPLHSAVATGAVEVVRLLIAHGADVNARQQDEFTPLHGAAENGNIEIVQMLLAANASVNSRKEGGITPLGIAEEKQREEVITLLRKHGGTA